MPGENPVSAYGREVAPAATATVVLVAPSVIVAVPAGALASESIPLTLYVFVAGEQVVGVAVKLTSTVQEAGAVYVALVVG